MWGCSERGVDWLAAFLCHFSPMAALFQDERKTLKSIRPTLRELTSTGSDQLGPL